MEFIVVFIVVIVAAMWSIKTGGMPEKYRARKCTGKNWKLKFPNASKDDIRKFLYLFTDAFAFPPKQKLKFDPEDKIMDIYEALYPEKWMPDSLEVETLALDFEREYKINFENIWHDNITLGELFTKVHAL